MVESLDAQLTILDSHAATIIVAFFGGLVLFCMKMAQHFSREEKDKLPLARYIWFAISLMITLPLLGAGMTCIYLLNGDKISTLLAFQIGLTSPAIVQSLIIAAANDLAKKASPQLQEQQ
ncbi:hypothetical protein ACJX0I_05460 [Enterobacter hormaechei subsp. xiangfangensis]|uniref:Uncharacterized protein n=1 Tax=Enterobacter sichuanensis TaxID=2071710 RepID=A0ABS6GDI1_9ENTR|nr:MULTISPECIES: hypothetical protein [Enterobacter cloacae complex]EJH8725751.1 hypothetical protein [Cronobacter sakazakii]EJW0553500.1 hypothetical protein [Escherichia coli]EJJ0564458.1 hypothetical protein [Cronobacter sakazakii]EKK4738689.1 hypothetical protein [Cronobacter sakazakii]ELY2751993.1 hypothetical protein [Cronobacter sakazakii]